MADGLWFPYAPCPPRYRRQGYQHPRLEVHNRLYFPASQPPFDEPNPEGDHTYRLLPTRLRQADLGVKHGHYDPAEALKDYNSVFPLDRLRELAEAGCFAGLTPQGVSFMGYVTDAGTFAEGTARAIAQEVLASGADAAFLVPV